MKKISITLLQNYYEFLTEHNHNSRWCNIIFTKKITQANTLLHVKRNKVSGASRRCSEINHLKFNIREQQPQNARRFNSDLTYSVS